MRRCRASQDGRDAVRKSRKGADPVARGIRRRASKNLADARHRPRSFSYPTDPTRDLYGSISLSLGIRPEFLVEDSNNVSLGVVCPISEKLLLSALALTVC